MMEHYKRYSPEQLALDKYFQEWVVAPTSQSELDWREFQHANPDQIPNVNKAIELVKLSGLTSDPVLNQSYLEGWHKIERHTATRTRSMILLRTAAAVAAISIIGVVIYMFQFRTQPSTVYLSGFGETKRFILEDGSGVTLNANSKVTINHLRKDERHVTISGDAFFEITHTSNNAPFIVDTEQGLRVEVLGTAFNVNTRQDEVKIYLETGSVRIVTGEVLRLLKPGELADFSPVSGNIVVSTIVTDHASNMLAWRNNQYVMSDVPLTSVAADIKETFGKTVILEDSTMGLQRVTAKVPANDLNVLIQVISQALNLKIEEKDNELYFKKAQMQ